MCNSTCSCLLSYRLDYYFLLPCVLLDIRCEYLYPSQGIESNEFSVEYVAGSRECAAEKGVG